MIQGVELTEDEHYLAPVTYVPVHAHGDLSHEDCELGVIIRWNKYHVFVLYCKTRAVQATSPYDLVWG